MWIWMKSFGYVLILHELHTLSSTFTLLQNIWMLDEKHPFCSLKKRCALWEKQYECATHLSPRLFSDLKPRAVASLTVPGRQEFHFPHFSSNRDQFFLFFLKLCSFSSSLKPSGWATPLLNPNPIIISYSVVRIRSIYLFSVRIFKSEIIISMIFETFATDAIMILYYLTFFFVANVPIKAKYLEYHE